MWHEDNFSWDSGGMRTAAAVPQLSFSSSDYSSDWNGEKKRLMTGRRRDQKRVIALDYSRQKL
jgi:hypothetical protein